MKKTLLTLGLLSTIAVSAQNIVTFEDLTLAPNSNNDESDDNGFFTSGGTKFANTFTESEWGDYWSAGFSYSNKTDVTTPGYQNQYSCFAGSGANNSANFAVYYGTQDLSIDFGSEKAMSSVMLTNTTYAGLSMKNGDGLAKVFGSPNNAQGTPDGTNGNDFYLMKIVGFDADTVATDTILFYLADFRFADSTQDYILDEWETVDLSSLGNVRFLQFELESTDNNQYGMLTPAYFALDNLSFGNVGISELTETFRMFPNPSTTNVTIEGNAGNVTISDASGKIVYAGQTNGFTSIETGNWTAGFYTVEVKSETGTGRSKLVKR